MLPGENNFSLRVLPTHTLASAFPSVTVEYEQQNETVKSTPTILKGFEDKPYISLFNLEGDKPRIIRQEASYREAFQQELNRNVDFLGQNSLTEVILEPKPRNHFCQLCKSNFDDYLKHLDEYLHVRKQQKSYGQQLIKEQIKDERIQNTAALQSSFCQQISRQTARLKEIKEKLKQQLRLLRKRD